MMSLRPFLLVGVLALAACSSDGDGASPAPDTTPAEDAEVDVDAETDPEVDAESESDVDAEPEADPEVEDETGAGTDESDTDESDTDETDTDETSDDGDGEEEDSEDDAGGLSIDGPARVRPSCQSLTPGVNEFVLDAGGFEHDVRVFVPSVASSDPAPVVLNWHGLGSNGPEQAAYTGYETLAEAEGFLVVHATGVDPDGLDTNSWELAQFDAEPRDDIAFASALIDTVVADWCADEARVYSTGMSNGGLFTSELVCNLSERIAAAASIAGTTHVDGCSPARPVPYVAYHGTADNVVPYGAGEPSVLLPAEAVDALIDEGTLGEFDDFAEDFGCDPEPERTEETDEVIRYDFTGCTNDVPMTFYEIVEGGHTWPSTPLADPSVGLATNGVSFDVDATAGAWAFMSQHTL